MLSIANLRCEYHKDPIGIDVLKPRLSWRLTSTQKNVLQTTYHIQVADSKTDLQNASNLVWDTGKVDSGQSAHLSYQGPPLRSRQRYYWKVKVWDNQGYESEWSEPAFWEMGLLDPREWESDWIQISWEEDPSTSQPVQYFKKEFELSEALESARLYITALGLYEAQINGSIVGDQVFTPGWTSYSHRLQYQTFDITRLLQTGPNALSVQLGDGWYRGNMGWNKKRNFYGEKLALLAQLELIYEDGSIQRIGTDESWKAATGPILSSDIYNGEFYDARLEQIGWSKPGLASTQWSSVQKIDQQKDHLIAPKGPPIKRIESIQPIQILQTPNGETVFDMGQNMVGRIRLKVSGPTGTKIILTHAEVLDKQSNFYTQNLRAAQQQVVYILKGEGVETYEPKFTFMGFRYVKVEGWPGMPSLNSLTGIVIHSAMEITGTFECSDPLINQLQHNILWGQKGNFLDVPTDCPQRDERMGWTGDAQAFAPTATFNMEVAAFFTKWLADLKADQDEAGMVHHVIPNVLEPQAGAATGWADAATIIPWTIYLNYGDRRILEQQYDSMKAWVGYMEKEAGEDLLWNTGPHFGDWLFFMPPDDRDGQAAITDKYLLAQAFFAHSVDTVRKTAAVLKEAADEKYYEDLLDKVKEAFVKEYVTPNGRLVSSTQTAYVLALQFDLFPTDLRQQAAKRLIANLERYNDHLTTGFLGTPYLNMVLSRFGYLDKAYILFQQEDYPSWLYPVKKGATTIWERWDGIKKNGDFQNPEMNSFNHYAYGAIGDWMYKVIAGINPVEANPGYKQIRIAPNPGGTLSFARATLQSVYGKISSGWFLKDEVFTMEVEIPANTQANIVMPKTKLAQLTVNGEPAEESKAIQIMGENKEGIILSVGSGSYTFQCPASYFTHLRKRLDLKDPLFVLLENKKARALIQDYFPEVLEREDLEQFKHQDISQIVGNFGWTEERLKLLGAALRKI